MKTKLLAISLVWATAVIAESQTPNVPSPVAGTDELSLADGTNEGATAVSVSATEGSEGGDIRVDMTCEDATLADILRQFRKAVGANIISCESTNLNRRVSVSLKKAPWRDSLQAVLGMGGFVLEDRNGIYFVAEEHRLDPIHTRSFTLNHASAEDLAKLINESYGERDKSGKVACPIATVFRDANVVVVTATDKVIRESEAIVKAVDKAVAQVYIEARFIELSNAAMHDLGMKWDSLREFGVHVNNVRLGIENNHGRSANYGMHESQRTVNTTASDNSTVSTDADGKTTTSLTRNNNSTGNSTLTGLVPDSIQAAEGAGASAASMAWRNVEAFSGQISADGFSLAMSAFEKMSDVKVFSNPRIIVSNGKEAKVDMTTKFPNVQVTANHNTVNGSDSLDISTRLEVIPGEDKQMFAKEAFYSWGISLSVQPRISPDGLINVVIVPTISSLDTSVSGSPDGFYNVSSGNTVGTAYSRFPIISVQRLTTDFTMRDGSTAVIGGLSRTSEEDVDSGIPYLRKIPWIGPRLFGWKSRAKVQKEILVFVTVGIADPGALPENVGLPKNAILGREYVEGRALEPGDRKGGVAEAMKLDMRPVEDRQVKEEKEEEKVEPVEPVKTVAPASAKAEPAVETVEPVEPVETVETVETVEPVKTVAPASAKADSMLAEKEDAPEPKKIRHGRRKQ